MKILGDYIIINQDNPNELKDINCSDKFVINCGFSGKSSITVSGIDDYGITFCVQRLIPCKFGDILPQEFNVKCHKKYDEIYPCLETVTLLLLLGISPEIISKYIVL